MKKTMLYLISGVLITLFSFSCKKYEEVLYTFDNIPDRIWAGEDFWAVPLEGWQVKNGRLECNSNIQQATFSILPFIMDESKSGFRVTFEMGLLEKGNNDGSAGVIIGKEAQEEKDVRAAVYFGQGISMGVNTGGYAFIEQYTSQLPPDFDFKGFKIGVTDSGSSGGFDLTMNVTDMEGNVVSELSFHAENSLSGIMRKGFAFHINGDQHLTSIIQYGVDDFRDSGYSICPPAISTGYSRWFRPDDLGIPVQNRPSHGIINTGEYIDAFGNLNYIYAVGNPGNFSRVSDRYETKHYKASGFGMVIFDNDNRTITIESWRFLADVSDPKPGDQFPGWPLTISQFDNYGREAVAWLPTLVVDGEPDAVVEIIKQETDELEYSVRINGNRFVPKVFSEDLYRIRWGYPEKDIWNVIDNVKPLNYQNEKELLVSSKL